MDDRADQWARIELANRAAKENTEIEQAVTVRSDEQEPNGYRLCQATATLS